MIEVLRDSGRPWRVGHKGAAALAPENTIASFERALEHGVDILEFDVLDLADGTLVLAHSDDLLEVSHGVASGRVREKTLSELRRAVPALPTFDEALEFLAERAPGTGIQVDVKWVDYEASVVKALQRHGAVAQTLVSSFFPRTLRAVAELEPGLRLALSYPRDRRGLSRRRALAPAVLGAVLAMRQALPHRIGPWLERSGATVATLNHMVVSRATVERCHSRGAAVWAWTVDDRRALARAVAVGVDGIITNDPRIFAASLTT
ncbi:MAG: glycerophosphodiester phosphodiesterase [Gaiellaceae bacterium]